MGSIEQLIAALDRNSDLLERVVAGQEAAMAALANGGGSTRKPRAAKSAPESTTGSADTAADNGGTAGNDTAAPADTGSQAGAAETASDSASGPVIAPILSEIGSDADKLKAHVSAWTGGTEDAGERGKRVQLLKDIAGSLGVAPKFSDLVPHVAKAVFLVERAKALGVDAVDVTVDYDYDGDPAQGGTPAAGSESDFG